MTKHTPESPQRHLYDSNVRRVFLMFLILCGTYPVMARQSTVSETDERRFFDFLIGDWTIVTDDGNGPAYQGDDLYSFRPVLDGSGIYAEWYFNRGDEADPDYTKGLYLTAFDEMTETWSFYYVSPRNAMYYEGRKEGDNWYFYKTFNIDGDEFLQRQWWELEDDSTLVRTITNSRDGGETWEEPYVRFLERNSPDD